MKKTQNKTTNKWLVHVEKFKFSVDTVYATGDKKYISQKSENCGKLNKSNSISINQLTQLHPGESTVQWSFI